MFTGIIQAIGKVVKCDGKQAPGVRRPSAGSRGGRVWITAPFRTVRLGESITVDGVCLTVADRKGRRLAFDIGTVTRRTTTAGTLTEGSLVNLERALRLGDPLGGHWVSGHVEKTGRILKIQKGQRSWLFTVEIPAPLLRFVVPKGSLAIDGISLTVAALHGNRVDLMIIPHTLAHTTLGRKKVGSRVNVESDLLAKYALRLRKRRK